MSTYRLNRFSNPETLKRIEPSRLLRLLKPYRSYLAKQGFELSQPLHYQALVKVLMFPSDRMPPDLAEALYFIHEMATPQQMDALLEDLEAPEPLGSDMTPADVAVFVWLHDRDLLERKHAETFLHRRRSFESFLQTSQNGNNGAPNMKALGALEQQLSTWFVRRHRGRGCRIFGFQGDDEHSFLVRHGGPFRREGSLVDGEPASVFYRPEQLDIVIYNSTVGELRMNASTKGEKTLYLEAFGEHLFGDPEHFPASEKFTLEPLRVDGRASLVCTDIEGLEWIVLKELQLLWPGRHREIEIRKASDVFAVYEARGSWIPEKAKLLRASFRVKHVDSKTPRTVSLRLPNSAQFTRDFDSVRIEQWLERRGFIPS